MEKKYEYIILDLDGTLIEETAALEAQVKAVARVFGEGAEAMQAIVYAFFAANDRAVAEGGENKNNIPQYMIWMGKTLGVEVSHNQAVELAAAWSEAYQNTSKEPVLYPETVTFLEGLKERGYTPILASGGSEEEKRARLDACGIEPYFTQVFAAKDVGFQKQDIRFWQHVQKALDTAPEKILVVGNQINDDIQYSSQVGMNTILITRPHTLKKVHDPEGVTSDHVVTDLCDILGVI